MFPVCRNYIKKLLKTELGETGEDVTSASPHTSTNKHMQVLANHRHLLHISLCVFPG